MSSEGFPRRAARLLLFLACMPGGLEGQAAAPPDLDPLGEHVQALMDRFDVPSISVAAAFRGEIVWLEGFGWADRERGIQATEHTAYAVASVTKPITATAVMLLSEAGQLRLDDPVNDHLGAARVRTVGGEDSAATLRHLLSHTAGLPVHHRFFYEDESPGRPPMESSIARYGVQITEPGETYTYANLGYGILDQVIERVSDRTFESFLEEELFGPLGMTRSRLGVGPGLGGDVAAHYGSDGRPLPLYDFDHRGASAVYSSAADLLRFGLFHLGGGRAAGRELLSRAAVEEMRRSRGNRDGGSGGGYGLGWSILDDDGGYLRLEHTGGMPGVSAVLRLYPEEEAVIVVLSNSSNPVAGAVADAVSAWLLPGFLDRLSERRHSELDPPPGDSSPSSLAGRWAGTIETWGGSVPLRLEVDREGRGAVHLGEAPGTALQAFELREGLATGVAAGIIPTADAVGRPHVVYLHLWLRDGHLLGFASAVSGGERNHFALSSPLELVRVEPPEARPGK